MPPRGEILPQQQQPEAGAPVAEAKWRPPTAMAGSDEVNRNECKVRAATSPRPSLPASLLPLCYRFRAGMRPAGPCDRLAFREAGVLLLLCGQCASPICAAAL